ncbi:CDK5 and ABL1 enzyme substrate 2-like [Hylobates moloch]|uniref:CDK5 and ABL1 enzyme substrate 2-like n=1 Tax=Hylobates moloch TaxID=81572 RepID=UPI002674C052|nr:CDK5 and ABL1 enzyme substrate 2-like [Hylobates moloch]
MCAQRRVSAAARAPGSRRWGWEEEGRPGVRPTLSPPLPEPPPPPSVSFPHKPAQVRRRHRRARVRYCGQRSLMTSRTAPRLGPPPAGSRPRERPLRFWPAPPCNLGGPGAPARKSRPEKAAKAKTKNKLREVDGKLVERTQCSCSLLYPQHPAYGTSQQILNEGREERRNAAYSILPYGHSWLSISNLSSDFQANMAKRLLDIFTRSPQTP